MKEGRFTRKEVVALCIVAVILVAGGLIVGWHFGYEGIQPLSQNTGLSLSDIDYTYNLIHSDYYVATDTQPLVADAIGAMVAGLNDHNSLYLSPSEYQAIQAQQNGTLFDIGVEYVTQNGQALTLEVYPNTPAQAAGLEPGDIITQINGVDTDNLPGTLPITTALLGKASSSVILTVLKKDGSVQNLTLVRKQYTVPTVSFKMLANNIGYLKIYSFDPALQADFAPIAQTVKNDNVNDLVIDLRNNPGGDVTTALAMLNMFVSTGTLFSEQLYQSSNLIVHKAAGDAEFGNLHLVLIVNGLTASAAEIFTAALKENNRAIVVGTTTQGKATEESYFELSDGSAVRLIIGRWFAPDGEWTNGKGIAPNIAVPDTNGTTDVPLETALQQF